MQRTGSDREQDRTATDDFSQAHELQNALSEQPHWAPDEHLAALMQDAFHSKDELTTLPIELRAATSQASDYVSSALRGDVDGDVSPAEAWRFAEQFLDGLSVAEAQREVWDGDIARETVASGLQDSLRSAKISANTADNYMKAVVTLISTDSLRSTHQTGEIVLLHHQNLKQIAESEPDIRAVYDEFIVNPDIISRLSNINHDSQGNFDPDLDSEASLLYADILTQLGFDRVNETINSWRMDSQSINRIGELERHEKGASALLHNFYGIRNFERYSIDMLKRQFDEHQNAKSVYGIVVSAVSDRTDAFAHQWRDTEAFRELENPTRIVEAANAAELEERFLHMQEHFGAGKIEFAYINAHGESEGFDLGDGEVDKTTDISYMRSAFGERPVIILASCSSGEEQGIAQHLSHELSAVVVGPPIPAGVANVVLTRTDSGLKIEPQFAISKSSDGWGERTPVEAVLYIDGEHVHPDDLRYKEYFKETMELGA